MAKRVLTCTTMVLMLMLATATVAAPTSGAEVLRDHVKKANKQMMALMQHTFTRAKAATRTFSAQQASLQQCITGCAQACVDRSSPCDRSCAEACGTTCAQTCVSASGGSGSSDRCQNAQNSAEARNLLQQCNGFETDLSGFFDIKNHTVAARASINTFCSPGCQGAWNAAMNAYRDCIDADSLSGVELLRSMCESHDGEYCAWRLRAVDQLSACGEVNENNRGSRSRCEANTTRNRYCRWEASTNNQQGGECEVRPAVPLLQQACSPCYDRFVFLIVRYMRESIVGNATAEQIEEQQLVQALLAIQKNYYCSKHESTWCLPLVDSLDERVYNIEPNPNVTLATIRHNVTNMCTATGKVCLNKVAGAQVDLIREYTDVQYRQCLRNARYITYAPWRASQEMSCISHYRNVFQHVSRIYVDLNFMCRKNENDAWCLPLAQEFVRDDCFWAISRNRTCSSTCATWMFNQSVSLGCCWDRFAELEFNSRYPDVSVLPARVAAAFDARPAGGRTYEHNPGRQFIEVCANVSGNGFNTTGARAEVTARCPVVRPVSKELRLHGVRWNRLATNATFKAIMESALRADVSRSLGVPATSINGTLVPDETQQLTAGANASASTRRQQASASASASASTSGTKYQFELTLDSPEETASAAARYDTAVQTNQIAVTTTAAVVTNECSDCVGSPTAAPGQTAAPPPTGALFAAIVGAPTDGSSPTTSSPAVGAALLAAVAGAVAIAVVA